jgi:hypothetical protein
VLIAVIVAAVLIRRHRAAKSNDLSSQESSMHEDSLTPEYENPAYTGKHTNRSAVPMEGYSNDPKGVAF